MIALMCETPFQLINALNIAYTKFNNEKIILFIMEDMFESNKKFTINTNNDFIKGVYTIERNISKKNFIEKIISKLSRIILRYDCIYLRKRIPNFRKYNDIDKIICIKYSDYAFEIKKKMKRKKEIEIFISEEGIGEYLVKTGAVIDQSNKRYINKTFLMAPQLYKLNESNVTIEKSPFLNETYEFNNILDEIFDYKKDLCKFKDVLYFGQAFAKDYDIKEFEIIEMKILNKIKQYININNFSLKLHPRCDNVKFDEYEIIDTISPWECNINQIKNIENKVIISISSTAIITPKLLCNKEPYVICTAKLYEKYMKEILKEYNYYNNLIEFFENIKNLYIDKNKFMIPNDMEELESILLNLKEKGIIK